MNRLRVSLVALLLLTSPFEGSGAQTSADAPAWVQVSHGYPPPHLIVAGKDVDGATLYVAAGKINGNFVPGKTRAPFAQAWLGFGKLEIAVTDFEMLSDARAQWVEVNPKNLTNTLTKGTDVDGAPLLVARGQFNGVWIPGKLRKGSTVCLVPYAGKEWECQTTQLLVRE